MGMFSTEKRKVLWNAAIIFTSLVSMSGFVSKAHGNGTVSSPSPALVSPTFRFSDLQSLIATDHITDVSGVISLLPDSLRTYFTLVYNSGSLQGASFSDPRAILFGLDAKLIIAFNGSRTQKNYDELETIEFSDTDQKFVFRTVSFQKEGPLKGQPIFGTDQTRCSGCHGDDVNNLHPIWSNYDSWPGVYGENDDNMSGSQYHGAEYRQFLSKKNTPGSRYKDLLISPCGGANELDSSSNTPPYCGTRQYNFAHRPNAHFSAALMRLDAHRIAREFMQTNAWKQNPIDLVMSLLDCQDVVVPSSYLQQIETDYKNSTGNELLLDDGNDGSDLKMDYLSQQAQMNTKDLFLAKNSVSYDFDSGEVPTQEFVSGILLNALVNNDPDLKDIQPMLGPMYSFSYSPPELNEALASELGTAFLSYFRYEDIAPICSILNQFRPPSNSVFSIR